MIGLPKQKNNAKLGRTWHDKPWSFAQVIEAFLQCVHLTALWPRIPHSTKASKKLKLKNLNIVSVLVSNFQGQALNSFALQKKKHMLDTHKKILFGKLTCPLKVNGWKIYFLLKQSLSRGTCFSSCSGVYNKQHNSTTAETALSMRPCTRLTNFVARLVCLFTTWDDISDDRWWSVCRVDRV